MNTVLRGKVTGNMWIVIHLTKDNLHQETRRSFMLLPGAKNTEQGLELINDL